MSDKIRTGIAGCGYLGRHHARILTELPFSEPVGFVEANDATAAEIEAKHGAFGLVRCRSVKELLDRGATAVVDGQLVTNGGRVLAVTALGDTFENARNLAYEACEKIDFEGKTLRHDIGLRALRGRDAWDA